MRRISGACARFSGPHASHGRTHLRQYGRCHPEWVHAHESAHRQPFVQHLPIDARLLPPGHRLLRCRPFRRACFRSVAVVWAQVRHDGRWPLGPGFVALMGRVGRTSRPVSRVLCPPALAGRRVTAIHLGPPLPAASSGLPAGSGGPPSGTCAGPLAGPLLDLAPGGVYRAAHVTVGAGELLPHRFTLTTGGPVAVCFLWHCPAGHPGSALPTTLPCGARTFLDGDRSPTRPSGRLVRRTSRLAGA